MHGLANHLGGSICALALLQFEEVFASVFEVQRQILRMSVHAAYMVQNDLNRVIQGVGGNKTDVIRGYGQSPGDFAQRRTVSGAEVFYEIFKLCHDGSYFDSSYGKGRRRH